MKSFGFEFRMIAFNDLRPDPTNIRTKHDGDDDRALKQSILMNGLIEPFIVCKDDKSGYLIVDGHRTRDACREIFKNTNPEVPCIVVSQEADKQFTEGQLRKVRLLRELHTQKLADWDRIVGLRLYVDEMRELFPDMKDKDIAKSLGKSSSWLSQRLTIHDSGTFATPVSERKLSFEKARIIKSAPVEAQKALIDATTDFTLHDTERIVKLVNIGVRIDEAVRTVELSKSETPELQVAEAEVKERFAETGEDPQLPPVEKHPPSASETVHDGEGETIEEAVEKDDDSGRKSLQPPSSETTGIVGQAFERGGETTTELEKQEEALGEEKGIAVKTVEEDEDKKPTEPKPIKFVNRMLRLGEATKSHMNEKELEALGDANYRKLLKDYEEASFSIDGFRDFLHGRENNGSVQFNRAKRLHNAIREFDAHSISSVNEATNLRSIKIETKKKLTKDVDILDNIINGRKPPSEEGE